MSKNAMQKSKILYLAKIFEEQTDDEHGLTVNELIYALNSRGIRAERKSIYDDIETLKAFGMDIEMRKEKNFRYHLVGRKFELPELKLLVDSVQSSKFITHKKSMELIGKLEGLTSRHHAQKLSHQVFVSNRIKTMNESIYYTVDFIHEAINKNAKITFKYFDWNANKEKILRHDGKTYKVSPWALSTDDDNYYLVALDSDDGVIKHYRVDKMVNINTIDEKRDGAERFADFDLALYTQKTFSMYSGEEMIVKLRCHNSIAGVIIDRFGSDVSFFKYDDEHFEVNVKVAISHVFFSWVINFGDRIELISPEPIREKLKNMLLTSLEIYK